MLSLQLKCAILPALKFPFSASASGWEKELILLSRVSFSFRIESCWRCCARCQRSMARCAPPKCLLVGWERVMEREGAKSAASGKAGRCRGAATSPCRPLLSVQPLQTGGFAENSLILNISPSFLSASSPPVS